MEQHDLTSGSREAGPTLRRTGSLNPKRFAIAFLVLLLGGLGITVWWIRVKDSSLADRSLITGRPCSPPCWHRLIPGVSTQDALTNFLAANSPITGECRSYDNTSVGGFEGISCDRVEFVIDHGVVARINVYVSRSFTLVEVINKHGPPEAVWVGFERGPTIRRQITDLYYPDQGFLLHVTQDPPFIFTLSEETKVEIVSYFPPVTLKDFPFSDPAVRNELRPWHGYGVYECVGSGCPDN